MIKPKLRRIRFRTCDNEIVLASSFKLVEENPTKMRWNCFAERILLPQSPRQKDKITSPDINDTFQIIQHIKSGLSS